MEDSSVLVIANATEVDNRVWRKHILSASSSVLRSSTSDKFGRIVVQEIFVDIQVLLFRKDRIIGLEAILSKESIVALGLDIYATSVSLKETELADERM